jgi:iron complex outermembrane receptor protein
LTAGPIPTSKGGLCGEYREKTIDYENYCGERVERKKLLIPQRKPRNDGQHSHAHNLWSLVDLAPGTERIKERSSRSSKLVMLCLTMLIPACGQQTDLTNTPIEDLLSVKVTSVSKTQQNLFQAAAAVFVIDADDIRRSGATNIPDLLREVPGFQVAQINSNTWAISARGFNDRFSNELLVMVDGRTVYNPTFGGVFWNVLDLPLEDIERIEVIRGPGGSVWGANAVNGVVNVITKKARDTRGAMIAMEGGNGGESGTVQYGDSAGQSVNYRLYAKYLDENQLQGLDSRAGGDGWHVLRGGFRADSTLSSRDTLTFQGDLYSGSQGGLVQSFAVTSPAPQTVLAQAGLWGGFFHGAWEHTFSSSSESSLQVSYDRFALEDVLMETRGTLNIDFQHRFAWGERNNVTWGLGYRDSASKTNGNSAVSLVPANLRTQLFSGFLQDEIALAQDKLYLTLGAKLEHNYYTGLDLIPSARTAWTPDSHNTVWAAISRALRTPDALDASIGLAVGGFVGPGGVPTVVRIVGNPHIKNEGLLAYELGYRSAIGDRLSLDCAVYYNSYTDQETTEPASPFFESTPLPAHLVLPLIYKNLMFGETHGLEFFANWKVAARWTLSPGYSFEQIHMHLRPGSQDTGSVAEAQGSSPVHSAQLRSQIAASKRFSWDTAAIFSGRLTAPAVPGYTRLDTTLTWRVNALISLRVSGQNLLQNQHLEFVDVNGSTQTTLIKRTAAVKVTWTF